MSNLVVLYAQRRRQIIVAMIVGAVAVAAVTLYSGTLPVYESLTPATDGQTLHLASRVWLPEVSGRDPMMVMTRSADGTTFIAPELRAGFLTGLAACGGRVYALFLDGSVLSLGERADDWENVHRPAEWKPLGLANVDNAVWALGQNDSHTLIVAAALDNLTWKPLAPVAHAGDNITSFVGARSRGVDYVAWVETAFPPSPAGEKPAPETLLKLPGRLWLARTEGGTLKPLAPLEFARPVSYTFAGDDAGVHVYYQDVVGIGSAAAVLDPTLRVATFADGKWGPPRALPVPVAVWHRPGEIAAASLNGKTFLYSPEYVLGTLYVGTWGRELRGAETSQPFLVMPPTDPDLAQEIRWCLMATAAAFVAAGAAAAYLCTRKLEEPPAKGPIVYAAVTDRGMAAMLDFSLIYWLMQWVVGETDAVRFWTTLAAGYFIYGALLESAAGGQTLAKRLLGLRVTDASTGGPAGFSSALTRNLFKFPEMLTIGAGLCLSTRRFQRLGDLLGGTVVVKEFPAPAGEES